MKDYFYMKDLMNDFKISRDAVKYYEKKGLISSYRDKNRYRKFDRITYKKLESICIMKKMGFSLDKIKLILNEGHMLKNGSTSFEMRIQEIENQEKMLKIQKRLLADNWEFLKSFDEYYLNCHLYEKFYKCCLSDEICKWETIYVKELRIYIINERGDIESEKDCCKSGYDEIDENCELCEKNKNDNKIQNPAIRIVIKESEKGKVHQYIKEMYCWGKERGYLMQRKVYARYAYYREPEEEGVAIDLYLPIIL